MDSVEIWCEIPVEQWNRNLPEVELVKALFSGANRRALNDFFQELKIFTHEAQLENSRVATKLLKDARENYCKEQYDEAIKSLTQIIKNVPKNSQILREALGLRAEIFMHVRLFERAAIDYEFQIKELTISEEPLAELANIIKCYFALGRRKKVKEYLEMLKEAYQLRFNRLNQFNRKFKKNYDRLISTMEKELTDMKFVKMNPTTFVHFDYQPYLDFNKNSKIRHASIACSLLFQNNTDMIFSNRFIPKGEIVAVEYPDIRQQYGETFQCDNCFSFTHVFIPCFDCHFKKYCSYNCKVSDSHLHKFECVGYKLLIIPMLECEILFRLLVKCLILLKENVFQHQCIRDSKTAFDLFNNMQHILQTVPCNILNNGIVNYGRFPEHVYLSMVSKSFRLSIFISKFTVIIPNFFSGLNIIRQDIEIFLASLLLILDAKLLTSSFRISTNINIANMGVSDNFNDSIIVNDDVYPKDDADQRQNFTKNMFKHFDVDKESIIMDVNSAVDAAFNCKNFEYQTGGWSDVNCPIQNTGNNEINENNNSNDLTYRKSLKEAIQSWMSVYMSKIDIPSVLGVYLTMLKFNHSCDPNVRLIYLSSGILLAKTARDIATGEHLTVSYGCHYKQSDNENRLESIKSFKIPCSCEYCWGKFNKFFNGNVLCIKCKNLVSPSEEVCKICGCDLVKANYIYQNLIWNSEYQFSADERKDFYNMVYFLLVLDQMYPITNQLMTIKLMDFANFLAKKNFIFESYLFFIHLEKITKKTFVEMSIDLLYAYNLIVTPLFEMLIYNLEKPSKNIVHLMEKIYNFILSIIEFMIEINDFNVLYDNFTCEILKKYHILLNMKEKVCVLLLQTDKYKNIICSSKNVKDQENIEPLIPNNIEYWIECDLNSKSKPANNDPKFIVKRNIRCRAKQLNKLLCKSYQFQLKRKKTRLLSCQKLTQNENENYCSSSSDHNSSNDLKTDNFLIECESYFNDMIESRDDVFYSPLKLQDNSD